MDYVRPKKSLGQHFLRDKTIAQRIADSLEPVCNTVLEIGPGTGALTQFLLQRTDITLYASEVDRESIAYLTEHYPELAPRLLHEDFLEMDLAKTFPEPFAIIGNLPYNISSQIFFKILDNRDRIPQAVAMIQKEVAERMAEKPGTKTYGILSVLLQAYYDIEYLFTVHENVFSPPPKVKSAVVRLKRNSTQHLGCNEKLFTRVVKATFNQRRKTIRNSLKLITGNMVLPEHRFLTLRPERLSVAEFTELTNWLEPLLLQIQ